MGDLVLKNVERGHQCQTAIQISFSESIDHPMRWENAFGLASNFTYICESFVRAGDKEKAMEFIKMSAISGTLAG